MGGGDVKKSTHSKKKERKTKHEETKSDDRKVEEKLPKEVKKVDINDLLDIGVESKSVPVPKVEVKHDLFDILEPSKDAKAIQPEKRQDNPPQPPLFYTQPNKYAALDQLSRPPVGFNTNPYGWMGYTGTSQFANHQVYMPSNFATPLTVGRTVTQSEQSKGQKAFSDILPSDFA